LNRSYLKLKCKSYQTKFFINTLLGNHINLRPTIKIKPDSSGYLPLRLRLRAVLADSGAGDCRKRWLCFSKILEVMNCFCWPALILRVPQDDRLPRFGFVGCREHTPASVERGTLQRLAFRLVRRRGTWIDSLLR